MHCNFLVVSLLLELGMRDKFQFDIIKPFEAGSSGHYIRHEGPPYWSFKIPRDVTWEKLPKISKNHTIYKFCAVKKADLSSLEITFENTTYRKNEKMRDTIEENQQYMECSKEIDKLLVGMTILNVSAISKNRIPPCTAKMVIQDISYRRARAFGTYRSYSHGFSAKISLNWDLLIPLNELLDQKDPLMTMNVDGKLVHLVYIAGFLKLVTNESSDNGYKITPALGNPPENEIYEFLENPNQYKTISPLEVDITRP